MERFVLGRIYLQQNGDNTDYSEGGSSDWEKVDLSALGEVGGIYFTMTSTDTDPMWGINTAAYFCMDKLQVNKEVPIPEHTYTITVPKGASIYVGYPNYSGYNYKPFTEKKPFSLQQAKAKQPNYYNVSGKHNYHVNKAGMLTQAGVFTPSSSAKSLEITSEQLSSHNSKETDHDVNNNNGYNVAGIYNMSAGIQYSSGESDFAA